MKVSTKGRYAIRLMQDIAINSDGVKNISLKEISSRQEISIKYSEQIISLLCKAGLLKSTRGSNGGYSLVKAPAEYTIGEILRVTEGSLAPVACLEQNKSHCLRSPECPIQGFWEDFYTVINEYVDSVTLEDLMKNININIDYII